MSLGINISLPRKILLFLLDLFIKILWVIDKLTSFDIGYTIKTFFRTIILMLSLSFLIFLGYAFSTGYLHKIYVASVFPDIFFTSKISQQLSYPLKTGSELAPETTATSLVAMDKKSNKVLLEKNADDLLAPASTVKLMTAVVAKSIYDLEEVLLVPEICTQVEGTKAYLPVGGRFKVKDLIESMLIGSAGDSACVLAMSKLSLDDFVNKMNEKAIEIGLKSTRFSNPIGLDDAFGNNYSTALDLYKLSVYATSFSDIKDSVSKKNLVLSSVDGNFNFILRNTNRLLWEVPNSVGIKTGTTLGAGEVLIYEYKEDLKDIVIVVMGSKDRFGDTRDILKWIGRNYSWE